MGTRAPFAVLGLGDVLRHDDAFGPTVVRLLQARFRPHPEVDVAVVPAASVELAAQVQGRRAVLFVDAVDAPDAPGTLVEVLDAAHRSPLARAVGLHERSTLDALVMAEMLDAAPRRASLLGVVPGDRTYGLGLGPALREATDRAVQAAASWLAAQGAWLVPSGAPEEEPPWWCAA